MVHLQLLPRKPLLPRTGGADLLNQGRPLLLRFKDAVDTIEALYFECNWLEILCLKCLRAKCSVTGSVLVTRLALSFTFEPSALPTIREIGLRLACQPQTLSQLWT